MLRAALRRFAANPQGPPAPSPARLKGELSEYWAFSIDDDLRVVFSWEGSEAFLVRPTLTR